MPILSLCGSGRHLPKAAAPIPLPHHTRSHTKTIIGRVRRKRQRLHSNAPIVSDPATRCRPICPPFSGRVTPDRVLTLERTNTRVAGVGGSWHGQARGVCMTCCAMLGQFRVNCRNPLYNSRMSALYTVPLALVLTTLGATPRNIAFPTEDGGRVCAESLWPTHPRRCAR